MPHYRVNHSYASGLAHNRVGPWAPGQVIDMSDDDAARYNQDSPGVLSPVHPKPVPAPDPEAEAEPVTEAEREAKPARNRQHRPGRSR